MYTFISLCFWNLALQQTSLANTLVLNTNVIVSSTLKSCSIPIHRLSEIKNSHKLPAGRNFFLQSLCLKRYTTKGFKK